VDRAGEGAPPLKPSGLDIDRVVLLGRTYEEYAAYFALDDDALRGARVLDVASGVSSFGAEARARGFDVTGFDPIYGTSADVLERKCRADLDEVVQKLPAVSGNYVWGGFYRDVPDLSRQRETAYGRFLADYRADPSPYVCGRLPATGFGEGQFSLALVSYFLFLYEDQLDYDFHKAALLELGRITRGEVRVYPLVNLRAQPSPWLERFRADRDRPHWRIERRPVPFEFVKGSNEMLVIDTRLTG
jgi:hypothetical protein